MSGTAAAREDRPPAQRCAEALVTGLLAAGVREVVLAPGSRSAPLGYALYAADRAGALRLHVRLDERGAGFLALGLAKATGAATAVVTTSGTAAANLYPAVLEAAHAGVPLIAVTADRPAGLGHSGANQTTDQVRLFGVHVRGYAGVQDVGDPATWGFEVRRLLALATGERTRRPGPAHINAAFSDPLVPAGLGEVPAMTAGGLRPGPGRPPPAGGPPVRLPGGPATVLVAGDLPPPAGREVAALAERAGLPLFAEPSSNARLGRAAIGTYRVLLASRLAAGVERVVVFGRPTLSRPVNALLARADVELVVVSDRADWVDPGLRMPAVHDAVEFEPADPEWLDAWRRADLELAGRIEELLGDQPALTGPALAAAVWQALSARPGDPGPVQTLVAGSSNPVRDLDLAPIRGGPPEVYANRGLAGIDGTVSTAIGVALGTGRPAHALLGDLTFLHDLTGLLSGPEEPRADLRLVVAHDDGGSIFATLEHGSPAYAAAYERLFGTPQPAELAALCRGLGVRHVRLREPAEVAAALAVPPSGLEVVEAVVDRAGRRALDRAVTGLAATL